MSITCQFHSRRIGEGFWVSARKPVLAALRSNNQTWLLCPHLLPSFSRPAGEDRFPHSSQEAGSGLRCHCVLQPRCAELGQVRGADSPHLQHRGKVPGTAIKLGSPPEAANTCLLVQWSAVLRVPQPGGDSSVTKSLSQAC